VVDMHLKSTHSCGAGFSSLEGPSSTSSTFISFYIS